MKKLNQSELEQLEFENSDVVEMDVNRETKSFFIQCTGADLSPEDDNSIRLENLTISIKGWKSIEARIFLDDEFKKVEPTDASVFLTEVCEFSHTDGKTMLSGFSKQEGSWADYTVTGGTLEISTLMN